MPILIQPCAVCGEAKAQPWGALCHRCDEAVGTFSEATWALIESISLAEANVILLERREQLERGQDIVDLMEDDMPPDEAS